MKSAFIVASLFSSLALAASVPPAPVKAVVVLGGDSKVKGTVTLTQSIPGQTKIEYDISGLDPNAERGFHIHVSGDLSKGCAGAGGHFNPFGKEHGAPTDETRHVGDLGNIKTDAQGVAKGTIIDKYVQLYGPTSVLGRAIVVHAGTDDLGKGASADSKKTGNAGGRPACGVIGLSA